LFQAAKGFTGYFSDFKEVFIVVLLGILSTRPKLDVRSMTAGLAVSSVLLILAIFWSAIKTDYRTFMSEGYSAQVVLVPLEDRLAFLANRIVSVDWDMMGRGFYMLVKRVGYIDFLSATMHNVPKHIPFEGGALVGATVMHVLQPRLLFPDKPPLMSDSEVVQKYAKLHWGKSSGEGTSVSLGYLAELYIDFGILGALATMFTFGVLLSRAFKFVCSESLPSLIVNFGFAVMVVMPVMQFEQALVKMVGGFLITFITAVGLRRFIVPYMLRIIRQNIGWAVSHPWPILAAKKS
jgi:hypothetical protein